MKEFWNERYARSEYIYGKKPNTFFANCLQSINPGKLLLPAEGEGRNAVYAASLGWQVKAFDQSEEAKKKALQLADENNVPIHYDVTSMQQLQTTEHFDAIAIIYAHFHDDVRTQYHQQLLKLLRPDGVFILEAFHQRQMPLASGGPKSLELLYTKTKLMNDFNGALFIEIFDEGLIEIHEGTYHNGKAEIIRLFGRKIV
ncbi:MAG: methyltransferase domain-containing protein [Bacteroidetes bacterium]|jgi:cyclopropane fatty-acyl-phospholipid synthase-like methyltransferase|nr:methyltransferase domain-containing protein [Bacteroidota bacterium]